MLKKNICMASRQTERMKESLKVGGEGKGGFSGTGLHMGVLESTTTADLSINKASRPCRTKDSELNG